MSKFDTHGGYFAPKDYMKVETGGSHEENPNGGVQIGVDQEGTPNLLEEGEPVYKDYVYSDNIKASERFLKENNIPEKYAGELYSKIADSFFSEAENRPYDPISRNGLETMLGRLADAQEGQKAYNEQKKLKKELASLSTDELAALEEMLAAGEQQQMQAEPMLQEAVVPEQMPMQPVEQQVMANGGKVNRFEEAGKITYGKFGQPSYPLGGLSRFVDRIPNELSNINDAWQQLQYEREAKEYAKQYLESIGEKATDAKINKIAKDIAYNRLLELEFSGNQVSFANPGERMRWLPRERWDNNGGKYNFDLPINDAVQVGENSGQGVPDIQIGPGIVSGGLVDYPQPPSRVDQAAANGTLGTFPVFPNSIGRQPSGANVPSIRTPQEIVDKTNADILTEIDSPKRDSLGLPILPNINGPLASSTKLSNGLVYPSTVDNSVAGEDAAATTGNQYFSTLPRYAGAIGSGLLGLYNAFQKPDKYTATRYKPFVPSGRISLQDQRYNPVDQQMLMNQVLEQGNSAQRALRNSGLGPSTAAAIVAQDNNITGNLGNTLLQTWDANNQRRNQVIAANNQNEAQRAQFDYTIDAARQRALADAQMRNAYTDLQLQQLNYGAVGDKYAAIGNQVGNALQALSNIGQENFAMNQVNSNSANEGYGILGGGIGSYLPYYYRRNYKCGGKKK